MCISSLISLLHTNHNADEKNFHLKKLDNASENLQLFKASLLDYNLLYAAISGCRGVLHVASPCPSGIVPNPENWYGLSKTLAEKAALQYGEKSGLSVVTVCPSLILGPPLQSTVNPSILTLLKLLRGDQETVENRGHVIVDVRDAAEALIMVYEKPEVSGRYICSSYMIKVLDLVDKLLSMYPNYDYPKKLAASTMNINCFDSEAI